VTGVRSALIFFFIRIFLHVIMFTICQNQIYSIVKGPFHVINGPEKCLHALTLPSSTIVSANVYSGGTRHESRTGYPSSWLKIFLVSSATSGECRDRILKSSTTASLQVVCCSLFMIIRSQSGLCTLCYRNNYAEWRNTATNFAIFIVCLSTALNCTKKLIIWYASSTHVCKSSNNTNLCVFSDIYVRTLCNRPAFKFWSYLQPFQFVFTPWYTAHPSFYLM
jgi:hypothetical protein